MQFHKICLIGQDDLPAGHEWAMVEHDGRITLFITEAGLRPRVLEEAWAGYRMLTKPRGPQPQVVVRQRLSMAARLSSA